MATIQEILDKINASKSNNVNNNSFIDLMRQISGNPEDAIQPVNDTNSIYGHIVQMYTTLYNSGVDYAILADDIEAIQGLYERLNAIDSLYADKTKLDSLYADKAKLDQLFADKAVIDRVYGSITNIDRVHTSIDKLDTVYASVLKMDTVADNIADVNTVADNMIVLNEIYDNRVEIYAADNNATVATTKAIEASNSATIATTKSSEASASALAASTASNTSTTKATESAASAVLANTSAGSASTSAASASSNAAIATTKASEASVSASNASTSAANASTSASSAAASAGTSTTKANESSASAATALGYKNDVSTMKLAIETIYDTFDDRFLGTKTVDPIVDNDGNALIDGAMYFNTSSNAIKVYDVGTTTWYAIPQIYLSALLDVQLTSITSGNVLRWNGTKWINYTLYKADVGLNLVDNTADSAKNVLSATKLATARTINGVAFDGTANIIVSDSTAVTLTGNQTIAGVKTFSSGIVGNITGNAGTAASATSAAKWTNACTITMGGDLTGSVSIDGSANVTLSAQVIDNSHNHTNLSGTVHLSGSTGNGYNNSNIEVVGNGPANTIFPGIGFHQPALYAGTLLMLDGNTFQFQNQSGQPATLANPTSTDLSRGFIGMWSGSIATIPSGWALCNGANGTPDLRDRFVVGAGSTYGVGATGGSANAVVVSHTHTASTDAQGEHSHSAWTDSQGSHTHSQTLYNGGAVVSASGLFASSGNYDRPGTGTIAAAGSHSHNVGMGAAGSHGHNIAVSTNGESGTNKNLPPYYALCYIMKT